MDKPEKYLIEEIEEIEQSLIEIKKTIKSYKDAKNFYQQYKKLRELVGLTSSTILDRERAKAELLGEIYEKEG